MANLISLSKLGFRLSSNRRFFDNSQVRDSPNVHLGNGFVVTVTTCHNENRLASQAAEMLGNNPVSLPNLGLGQIRIHVNASVIEDDVRLSCSEGREGRRLYNHRVGGLKMKSFCARF